MFSVCGEIGHIQRNCRNKGRRVWCKKCGCDEHTEGVCKRGPSERFKEDEAQALVIDCDTTHFRRTCISKNSVFDEKSK